MKNDRKTRVSVVLEDKRDYVIFCEKIDDTNIVKTVRILDNILRNVELIYDDIIKNNKIVNKNVTRKLNNIIRFVEQLKEEL